MKIVSILIPAMNEEETLGLLIDDIKKTIMCLEYTFEIIVINDHSVDNTPKIAKEKGVILLSNSGEAGKGNSLRLGFSKASGDFIIMMDADYSHRAEDIPAFLTALENGAGLVVGSRIYGGSDEYTRVRGFGNIFFTWLFGFFHKRYLSDALNGYKAFRKEVVKDFQYNSVDFEIEIELLVCTLRKGWPIVEISSHERSRGGGQPKSRVVKHGFKFLYRIVIEYLKNKKIQRFNK